MKRILIITGVIVAAVVSLLALTSSMSKMSPIHSKPKQVYFALGDSVAAGDGLKSDMNDITDCGRSESAYPNQIAKALNLDLHWQACSGATTTSGIIGSQPLDGTQLVPQLSGLPNKAPTLITITIGANDIKWTDLIGRCYVATCGTDDDTAAVDALRTILGTNLKQILGAIKQRYQSDAPRVVVTGYYQVFPDLDVPGCRELNGVTTSERLWWRSQEDALNQTIQSASNGYDFVKFVAVSFAGHELCTADSWVQDATSPAPFHPTLDGQTKIAKSILSFAN